MRNKIRGVLGYLREGGSWGSLTPQLVKYFSREVGWEKAGEIVLEGVLALDLAIKEVVSALWRKVLGGEMGFDLALRIARISGG